MNSPGANDLKARLVDKLMILVNGKTSQGVNNNLKVEVVPKRRKFTLKLLMVLDFADINPNRWTSDKEKNDRIKLLINNYNIKYKEIEGRYNRRKVQSTIGDDLPTGIVRMAKVYVARKRKVKVGDKMAGRHGNKGIVARIVRQRHAVPRRTKHPGRHRAEPAWSASRMNLGQIYETVLGWAGQKLGIRTQPQSLTGEDTPDKRIWRNG